MSQDVCHLLPAIIIELATSIFLTELNLVFLNNCFEVATSELLPNAGAICVPSYLLCAPFLNFVAYLMEV